MKAARKANKLSGRGPISGGTLPLVKISPPAPSEVLLRKRLFTLLDAARKKQIIWVAGPAGSGKTTLVSSWLEYRKIPCLWYQVDEGDSDIASFFYYMGLAAKKAAPGHKRPLPLLAPEYFQGISTFTRRYFEELYRRITPRPPLTTKGMGGFVMVFDNFQDAAAASFHTVMSHALDTIPEGVTTIVLGRRKPPAEFSRLDASNKIVSVGWEEIRFTLKESGELLKAQGHAPPTTRQSPCCMRRPKAGPQVLC